MGDVLLIFGDILPNALTKLSLSKVVKHFRSVFLNVGSFSPNSSEQMLVKST